MRALAVIALLLVALIAVLVIPWWGGGGKGDDPVVAPSRAEPSAGLETTGLFPPAEPPPATAAEETRGLVDESPAREPLDRRGFEPWPQEGRAVRVVDATTGEPVPGAEVRFLREGAIPDDRREATICGRPLDDLLDRYGRRFRADEQGMLRVPRTRAWLVGIAPGRWGTSLCPESGSGTRELALHPDTSLAVRVVDGAGAPLLGIPVQLIYVWDAREIGTTVESGSPDGFARFAHIPAYASLTDRESFLVRLPILAGRCPWMNLVVHKLPSEPVSLVAPPLGRLEVHALDGKGNPLREPAEVKVDLLGVDYVSMPETDWSPFDPTRASHRIDPGDGPLVVFVALGEDFAISGRASPECGWAKETTTGPSTAGGVRRVELRFAPVHFLLVGRLVDPEGEPLRSTRARFWIRPDPYRPGHSPTGMISTDEDGVFRILWRARDRERVRASLTLRIEKGRPAIAWEARAELPGTMSPGKNDLGNLVLSRPPLLLAGVVMDDTGEPVRHALLRVYREARSPEWRPEPTYLRASDLQTRTDDEGEFAVHGYADAPALAIRARRAGHVDLPYAAFVPPRDDIVLLLPRKAGIRGRVILEEGDGELPDRKVRISVHPEGDPEAGFQTLSVEGTDDFHFSNLVAGRYTVTFRHGATADLLLEVPGVSVRGAEVAEDPRLTAVDLRGRIHRYHLRVVDADGRAIEGVRASYRTSEETSSWSARVLGVESKGGVLVFDTTREVLDVRVSAEGFRTRHLGRLDGDAMVTLEAGLSVKLVLSGGGRDLVGSEYVLYVGFYRGSFEDPELARGSWLGPEGEVRLTMPEPGSYCFAAAITCPDLDDGWFSMRDVQLGDPPRFEVLDTPDEQVFIVSIPPACIAEAIRRLGEEDQ